MSLAICSKESCKLIVSVYGFAVRKKVFEGRGNFFAGPDSGGGGKAAVLITPQSHVISRLQVEKSLPYRNKQGSSW
jgi:hypothetical protein